MSAPVKTEAPSGTPGTKIPTAAEVEAQKLATQETNSQAAGSPSTEPAKAGESVITTERREPTREEKLLAAQEALLRDQQRQISELTQRTRGLDERVTKSEKGPEPTTEELNDSYWKNPVGILGQLIQKELAVTVAPINERLNKISQSANLSAYDQMKAKVKAEYADIWDKIEPAIDQWAHSTQEGGQEVNEQLLNIAALTASGAYYRGSLPGMDGRPDPAPAPVRTDPAAPTSERTVATPPHLRPSAPPTAGHEREQKKEVRALTENEARLARERNQTPEQFLAWLDVPPEQVVHSTIGRPEKK